MKVRLEYNPNQEWPFHFAGKYDVPNTFGWHTIKENIDEDVANRFVRDVMNGNRRVSVSEMRSELQTWLSLHA